MRVKLLQLDCPSKLVEVKWDKLKHNLFLMYKKGKNPINVNLLQCFSYFRSKTHILETKKYFLKYVCNKGPYK